jgi:hypothetical protein
MNSHDIELSKLKFSYKSAKTDKEALIIYKKIIALREKRKKEKKIKNG